jgi:tol-pal system protein YbgF
MSAHHRIVAAPLAAAALGLTLLLSGEPAHALFGDDEARRAIIELRARIELQGRESQARLAELGGRIDALGQRLDRIDQSSRGQLELNNQIELLRQEIARLRGQLEVKSNELGTRTQELAAELAKTQLSQRNQFSEIDQRVRSFEPVSVSFEGRNITVDPEERRLYEGGLAALRDGEFASAAGAFASLRQRWPASPYAPNALYWSGSAQFAMKDYKGALTSLQRFAARHPEHARVPDALLALGLCHLELGDKRAARKTLESLVEKHPTTPAAAQANERLAGLR